MIAPIEKIQNLTTEDVLTLFGDDILNSCFEDAFKFVNNLITDSFVYESLASSDLDSSRYKTSTKNISTGLSLGWNDADYMKNRRILFVNRRLSGTTYIECSKLDSNMGNTAASMSGSIHFEEDPYTPSFYVDNTGKLEILPDSTVADVYYMTYPKFGERQKHNETHQLSNINFSDVTKESENILFYGTPEDAMQLIYIQMSLNLIQYYMSNFVHEEEDTELTNLLGAQVVSLDKDRKEHLQTIVSKFGNGQIGDM